MKKPKETSIRVRCNDEEKLALQEIADLEERTLSQQVLYFLKQDIKRYFKENQGK